MVVDLPNGVYVPRRIGEPLSFGVARARDEFGFGVMNPANSIREIVEAIGAMPWDAREQDILELSRQFDPRRSTGQFLQAALWPLFQIKGPAAAAGIVNLNYKVIVTSPTPVFAAGDIEFNDGAGVRYTGTADVNPPDKIIDLSALTGTDSETIGSGNSRISQAVPVLDTDFPQALQIRVSSIVSGAPQATVRVETDSAGSPSGILADSRLEVTGYTLAAGTNDVIFTKGAKIASGTYHIVVIVSGGTTKFDGGTGGTADQVKIYTGSWANSATVENLKILLYNGGEFPVASSQLGEMGNIEAGSIGTVRANNGTAQTTYDTKVASFENLEAFSGGRDAENSEQLRARARRAAAARGTSSPGGIVFGLLDGSIPGITFVDILENDSLIWGSDATVLNNSGKTGAAGDLIDGATYFRTAQRFVVSGYSSISALAFKLNADTASTITFRVETDAAGSPSGTLAKTNFQKTGVVPAGTARVSFSLAAGDFLDPGTYWLVATRTAGSFRFDGLNSGSTNNVKRYNGSAWALSSALQDMNVEIYGGVPGKSFELFVEGASDDDVAQGIYGLRAPGIKPYGSTRATAKDVANRDLYQFFSRPTNIDDVFDITVQVTDEFAGTEDDIRDLITEYIAELGIKETLVAQEARGRLMVGDTRTLGVFDITKFRLGKKSSFATPASLTGTEITNLTLNFGERHRVINPATDIRVQLDPAPV